MNFEHFSDLKQRLRYGSFSTNQLFQLFGEIAGRVCGIHALPGDLRRDISELDEVLQEKLDDVEERENAGFHEPLETV